MKQEERLLFILSEWCLFRGFLILSTDRREAEVTKSVLV